MTDSDEGSPDLEGRVEHLETGLSKIMGKLDELLTGGHRAAEKHEGDKLDRPDRKSTRLNSSHLARSRMPSSA